MDWVYALVAALLGAVVAALAVARAGRARARARVVAAQGEASALREAARSEAAALVKGAETTAREECLDLREAAERELIAATEQLARRQERMTKRAAALVTDEAALGPRAEAVSARDRELQSRGDKTKNVRQEAADLEAQAAVALQERAGATAAEVRSHLVEGWIEDARAEAAQLVRSVDQGAADPEQGRLAKRVIGISIGRYQGHYLTERLVSNIPLPPGFAEQLVAGDRAVLTAIEEVTGVKTELADTGERIRLDSADGVAREIARRAISKLVKGTAPRNLEREPKKWVEQISANLDREIMDLGRKAFAELEIPRANPEIVRLVGRLNYRTSYTQNQWKHAREAAFLAGMMASELRLDVKLARRATLLHDIGKALSHEIEGSHAVIGADYARRLGEDDLVVNAIAAHHGEEAPASVYAFLVAAADALSGARPGARREQTDSYASRLEDLERIGGSFRGVERAFAAQGGREVRVYVRQDQVDDRRALELSAEIARKISDQLTFPGQIKVTVIRQLEAVAVAS